MDNQHARAVVRAAKLAALELMLQRIGFRMERKGRRLIVSGTDGQFLRLWKEMQEE